MQAQLLVADQPVDHVADRVLGVLHQIGADAGGVVVAVGQHLGGHGQLGGVGGGNDRPGPGDDGVLDHAEPQGHRHQGLDGRHAHLAVALGHVAVARGELGALGVDRELDPRALGELPDVEVAAHAAADVGRQRAVHALAHGRHAQDAHERRDRDARLPAGVRAGERGEAGALAPLEGEQLNPGGAAVVRLAGREGARHAARARVAERRGLGKRGERGERLVPQRPEQAEDRADHHVAEVHQRADVQDLDLEDVAGLGALHLHRAGQRVHPAQVEGQGPLRRQRAARLPDVQGVAAQQLDHLAGAHGDGRRQVAVPAVVQHLVIAVQDPGPLGTGHHVGGAGPGHVHPDGPGTGRDAAERGRGCLAEDGPLYEVAVTRAARVDEAHRCLPGCDW